MACEGVADGIKFCELVYSCGTKALTLLWIFSYSNLLGGTKFALVA